MKVFIFAFFLLTPAVSFAGVTNAIGAFGSIVELLLWGLLGGALVIAWLIFSSKRMKKINKTKPKN